MSSSEGVAQALVQFAERFNAGEIAGFDATISTDEDSFVIGTQRWASGRTEWLANYTALIEKGLLGPGGAGLHLETSGVHGFDERSAGWAVGWVIFVFPAGSDCRLAPPHVPPSRRPVKCCGMHASRSRCPTKSPASTPSSGCSSSIKPFHNHQRPPSESASSGGCRFRPFVRP